MNSCAAQLEIDVPENAKSMAYLKAIYLRILACRFERNEGVVES
jgi:hypothetical protein